MKKRVNQFLLSALAAISITFLMMIFAGMPLVSAAENQSFDKSYACLQNQVSAKGVSSLSNEELAFSLLALSYNKTMQDEIKAELEKRKSTSEACWPASGCTLKDTSIVLLAYDYIGTNTSAIESWLLKSTKTPDDLIWYLQIDNPSNENASCTINYDNSSKSLTISSEKKLSGNPGNCLSFAYNNYWLEIKNSCYDKNFEISCDKDFITSTLFRKRSETNKYFISALTQPGSPGSKVEEKIESLCFKQGSSCNYEGSLWASLALQKKSKDIKKFLPYLIALSSESSNKRYLPSAVMYSLTTFEEYFTELTGAQKKEGYWQESDASRRYYDTALAIYALYKRSSGQREKAIDYLLLPNVQGNGCWGNSIRDTAMLLFTVNSESKPPVIVQNNTSKTLCTENSDYSCTSSTQCIDELNGTVLSSSHYCYSGDICCSKKAPAKTCSAEGGRTCLSSQSCSTGGFADVSESYCCLGDCVEPEEEYTCESAGADYTCRVECSENEELQYSYTCPENGLCCLTTSIEPPEPTPERSYWWIWLLVILVILVVLAIIFRNQLTMWWFKITSKFKKGPMPPGQQRPLNPQLPMRPGMPPRPMPPGARPPQRPFAKEKELDETLKRLRQMGGR